MGGTSSPIRILNRRSRYLSSIPLSIWVHPSIILRRQPWCHLPTSVSCAYYTASRERCSGSDASLSVLGSTFFKLMAHPSLVPTIKQHPCDLSAQKSHIPSAPAQKGGLKAYRLVMGPGDRIFLDDLCPPQNIGDHSSKRPRINS